MRPLVVDLSEAEVGEEGGEPLTFMNALEAGGMYRGVKSAVLSPSSQLVVDGENQTRNVFAALPEPMFGKAMPQGFNWASGFEA